jgi:soluble lytic murein transglycosylase-like protein
MPGFVLSPSEELNKALKNAPISIKVMDDVNGNFSSFLNNITTRSIPGGAAIVDLAYKVAEECNIDPALLLAVVYIESNGDYTAKQKKPKPEEGTIDQEKVCKGLMQLLPSTARSIVLKNTQIIITTFVDEGHTSDVFDPYKNLLAGAVYLSGKLSLGEPIAAYAYKAGHGDMEEIFEKGTKKMKPAGIEYATKVMQAAKLFHEMEIGSLREGRGVSDFISSEKYKNAVADIKSKKDGGYLEDSDLAGGFCYR